MISLVVLMLPLTIGQDAPTYNTLVPLAIALDKPLVIGVGCEPPRGPWIGLRVESPWHGWTRPCVIVSRPRNGELIHVETLHHGVGAGAIGASLRGVPVPLAPVSQVYRAASVC